MIENIRKFKGLLILGLALVIFALVIGIKNDLFNRGGGGRAILKIAGRTYDDREYYHLGKGSHELTMMLAQAGNMDLYQFVMGLSSREFQNDEKFFIGRMILRKAKDEFGVYPGDEEIADYIRGLRAFADKDGKFDEDTYRNFVTKGIGRLGMTEKDLQDLVSDVLAARKISTLIGSGLGVSRDIVARNLALDNQQIEGELASLGIDPYQEKIQPTDEEIKTYWETIQDSFTTEPLRKFSYIIATPEVPVDPDAANDKGDEKESIADAAATDEAKKKKEAEKAAKAAKMAEERRAKQLETDKLVDDFNFQLLEQNGSGFEELAKANKWEVKTTELFPRTKAPADLDVNLRSSSRGGKAVDELFNIEVTTDPVSKYSPPVAIGENQWLIARLDGEEKSRPKTFEEAKDEARAQYISEKATEALKKATEEARDKIKAALESGKSFADAAKEAGISETHPFTKLTSTTRPDTTKEPRNLFQATRNVDPGALADIITEADRTFIIYVAKREVVKTDISDARIDGEMKSSESRNEMYAFPDWIAARVEDAKVEQLYRQ